MVKSLFSKTLGTIVCGSLAFLGMSATAVAGDYPDRPIRMVVGFNAGGTTDVLARIFGKGLSEELGQPVVIENKPGAGSNIATDLVRRAKGDGYTLLMMAITSSINQTLYKNIQFDITKDLTPVALVGKMPNVVVASLDAPFNSIGELVSYAKKHPEEVVYASSGKGTSTHLTVEMFMQLAGIKMLHVPFSGSSPALTSLLAGRSHVMFDNMPASAANIKAGKVKAFAVTTDKRPEAFPEIPTLQELGYPSFNVSSWFGIMAPAGTPQDIRDKLNAAIHKIAERPEVKERLKTLGAEFEPNTTQEYGEFIKGEVARWADVIKKGNISID